MNRLERRKFKCAEARCGGGAVKAAGKIQPVWAVRELCPKGEGSSKLNEPVSSFGLSKNPAA